MKYKFIIALLLVLLTNSLFSQIGVKGGFSLGKQINSIGFLYTGGNLGLTYEISERLRAEVIIEGMFKQDEITYLVSIGSQAGFMLKTTQIIYNLIPITIGADYRFLEGRIKPYAGLNAGVISKGSRLEDESYNSQYFTMHPKAGVNIELTEKLILDFVIKHHFIIQGKSTNLISSVIGMNIGANYRF